MPNLTHLNIAYMASDKLLYLIAKFCRGMEELCLDHSNDVSDRGIKFLSGWHCTSTSSMSSDHPLQLLEASTSSPALGVSKDPTQKHSQPGCRKLQYLSLQGCTAVTDQAIWHFLVRNKEVKILRYHQSYSVAEILCNECRKYDDDSEQRLPELSLQTFDHPFPYGLNLPDNVVNKVKKLCPEVRILNLVSSDENLPSYTVFSKLTKATIELEDAFGKGLLNFLETVGHQLKELTISCGSGMHISFMLITLHFSVYYT